jgi:hypothetical protein
MMGFECAPELTQVEIDSTVAALQADYSIIPALRLRVAIMDGELSGIKAIFIDDRWQRFHDDGSQANAANQSWSQD